MYDSETKVSTHVPDEEEILSEEDKNLRFENALADAFEVLRKLREDPGLPSTNGADSRTNGNVYSEDGYRRVKTA